MKLIIYRDRIFNHYGMRIKFKFKFSISVWKKFKVLFNF